MDARTLLASYSVSAPPTPTLFFSQPGALHSVRPSLLCNQKSGLLIQGAGLCCKALPIFGPTNQVFSINARSRFASVVIECPGTSEPSETHLRCPCSSVVQNKQFLSWGAVSAQKALYGSMNEARELLEDWKRKVFTPTRGN